MTGSAPAPAAPEGEDYHNSWICAPRQFCPTTNAPTTFWAHRG